ncbi:MAG: DUF1987 domain-containing protein [Bacteroidales bacterium]|nr:DUF1987 domain-containing protein [Bacteroidales bacterium]
MLVFSEQEERFPLITYDDNTLTIEGRSFMDDAVGFYRNILARIKNELPTDHLLTVFNLEYFNTSSSKCILEIFRFLYDQFEQGKDVRVEWYYSERFVEMHEAGEDYKDLVDGLPFEIIEIEA